MFIQNILVINKKISWTKQTKGHTIFPRTLFGLVCNIRQLSDSSFDTKLIRQLVTGCSSGIGEALAQYIAKSSNRVVATARNPASPSSIPDSPNVLKLPLDVTSIPSIESALSKTMSSFHRIDVVVNNAGYTLVGDTEAAGDAESRALMDTNFWGMVDVTKRALGIMRDENSKSGGQQGGVVLNVSSMGGWFGFPACSFYHASKFAMEGWTESVAKELPVEWNSKSRSQVSLSRNEEPN